LSDHNRWAQVGVGGRRALLLDGRWLVYQPGITSHWQIFDQHEKVVFARVFDHQHQAKAVAKWLAAKPSRLWADNEQQTLF
jgi:hypothetical protein